MESNACTHCGAEIESKGIQFRGKIFCSDECCEDFEADFVSRGGPGTDGFDDDFDPDDLGDELGYRNGEDDDLLDDDDDDDYMIDPVDF